MIIQQPLFTTICVNRFCQLMMGRPTKNTAYILCKRSVSLTDLDSQMIVLFCIKGCLLTQSIIYPWLKLVTYGLSVMMLKSLNVSLTISVTLILFICYFTKWVDDGNISGALSWSQWMPPVD